MSKEKTYEEVHEELKLLAKNCKVPIITATQKRSDRGPNQRAFKRDDGIVIIDYVDLITPHDNSK